MKRLFLALDTFLRSAERLCGSRDRVGAVRLHAFPDGEMSMQIDEDPGGREVIVVAPLHRPNETLVPLLLLGEELKIRGAEKLTLAAPYLPYMRQDTEFKSGDIVSARALARLLSRTWDEVYTVDPHLHRIDSLSEIFDIPATAVSAAPAIARWIESNIPKPLLIGPDEESEQWVRKVADHLDCPWYLLDKQRIGDREVRVEVPDGVTSRERTPVFIDDIISTGHTLAIAREELLQRGVDAKIAIGVHGVYAPDSLELLANAGFQDIVSSNTIPNETSHIDALAELAICFER